MRFYLKGMCDAVIDSLESPSEDFQDSVREVFCKMDEAYKLTGLNDTKRAEKLSYECRHILVVLRLFPIELQLAMDNLYKKTLWGFLSIYLDFKMMLIDQQPNKETYFDQVMKEIFLLLGTEDKTCIWSVVVTSHTLNRIEILKLLSRRCIEATKNATYDHDQYIRMIWVLHVFFSQCKRSGATDEPAKVLETALKLKQPPGLCKWMCHHFPGFGWKGLTDANVHETLVSEKQPKSFFKQVYQAISKDDTLKYKHQSDPTTNGIRDEDSSSQSSESTANAAKKRANSQPLKELEASSKKMRTDSEIISDPDKSSEDKPKRNAIDKNDSQENEDETKQDSLEKTSNEKKVDDSNMKFEASSKPTKTLGPGRSKPTSLSSFLDEEDTVDINIGGVDNSDNESDGSKQANKENKNKSDLPSEEDVLTAKRDKSIKKKTRRTISETSEESGDTKADKVTKRESKRSKSNQNKEKASKTFSDSETDVDTIEEIKKANKTRGPRSVKRKVNDDSDSEQTIAESDITETNENDNVGDSDSASAGRRPSRKSNKLRSQSAVKKPQPKKLKADSLIKIGTTIERCEDNADEQESKVLKKLAYVNDELQKMVDEYQNGKYAYVFDEFEAEKMVKGAEPYINLSPLPPIQLDTERESTLADVLHNNKQKAKEQKQLPRKRKSRR